MMCMAMIFKKVLPGDFPSCPVVKNSPSNAEDVDSIPGWGTKMPCVEEQLSPYCY